MRLPWPEEEGRSLVPRSRIATRTGLAPPETSRRWGPTKVIVDGLGRLYGIAWRDQV